MPAHVLGRTPLEQLAAAERATQLLALVSLPTGHDAHLEDPQAITDIITTPDCASTPGRRQPDILRPTKEWGRRVICGAHGQDR